jgi:hypothetical protein
VANLIIREDGEQECRNSSENNRCMSGNPGNDRSEISKIVSILTSEISPGWYVHCRMFAGAQ